MDDKDPEKLLRKLAKKEKAENPGLESQRNKFQRRIRKKNFMASPLFWAMLLVALAILIAILRHM